MQKRLFEISYKLQTISHLRPQIFHRTYPVLMPSPRPSNQHQYGDHVRQRLTSYDHSPNSTKTPLIFIHGGAWVDPNNTDMDADKLSSYLPYDIPLFSIDYRLTPEVKYPKHNEDVLSAIKFILDAHKYEKIKLAGHSVGSTIILSILGELKGFVDEVVLIDGIFDLNEWVKEYPSCEKYVSDSHDDYENIKPLQLTDYGNVKFNVVHSYQDELLSLGQTRWLIKQLENNQVPYTLKISNLGEHEEVYRHTELAKFIESTAY